MFDPAQDAFPTAVPLDEAIRRMPTVAVVSVDVVREQALSHSVLLWAEVAKDVGYKITEDEILPRVIETSQLFEYYLVTGKLKEENNGTE